MCGKVTLRNTGLTLLLLAAGLVSMLGATAAWACVICLPYPKTTHADTLLASDAVALTREDPSQPFALTVVEMLKGSAKHESTDVFLPSSIRRQLSSKPADGIVLIRREGSASWIWLSYAGPAYQAFVRSVLAQAPRWRDVRGQRSRFAFFAARLNDADAAIRDQAALEVARAPYSSIRQVASRVPVERVRAVLADWRLLEWHRLYILFLGQSNATGDRAHIREKFERSARHRSTTNLSAWAIAYIETDQAAAIEKIEDWYFATTERSRAELEAILQALSVLAASEGPLITPRTAWLRKRLVGAYTSLLQHHPSMAGWVAREMTRWRRNDLAETLAKIRQSRIALDPPSALAVDTYLNMAARFTKLAPLQ